MAQPMLLFALTVVKNAEKEIGINDVAIERSAFKPFKTPLHVSISSATPEWSTIDAV